MPKVIFFFVLPFYPMLGSTSIFCRPPLDLLFYFLSSSNPSTIQNVYFNFVALIFLSLFSFIGKAMTFPSPSRPSCFRARQMTLPLFFFPPVVLSSSEALFFLRRLIIFVFFWEIVSVKFPLTTHTVMDLFLILLIVDYLYAVRSATSFFFPFTSADAQILKCSPPIWPLFSMSMVGPPPNPINVLSF